jgi:hypothetical protein
MRWCLFALCLGLLASARADETVAVCSGYGCLTEASIRYTEGQLGSIRRMLFATVDAENERKTLANAVGLLYGWAGDQSDVHNDRGGNYADDNVPGKMDCIDHSTSTTRLLRLLENRGYLRWHRVLEPESRNFAGLIPVHWSAVIEELEAGEAARFVVDSWFVDNGFPAVILPLDEWKKGAGPDV